MSRSGGGTRPRRGSPLPPDIEAALRELNNALGKAAMYPAGHRLAVRAAAALTERLASALEARPSVLLGVTPNGLLLDGTAAEPLSPLLRDLAARLHRKNVGTIHLIPGLGADEVAAFLAALASPDAEEAIGREGLRLGHLRVEPLIYDVVAFADVAEEIDEVFWTRLVEAAFGRRLGEGEAAPTPAELALAIEENTARPGDAPKRVYEALAAFATALARRGERTAGKARRRFVEVLSALSRPTAQRVLQAAPTSTSRRRFLRETLEQVPPALMLQLIESVAEADGDPISPQLRWMLGKLAATEGADSGLPTGAFTSQVIGLLEHWEGNDASDDAIDPRMRGEGASLVALALQLSQSTPPVLEAARREALAGRLDSLLVMLDHRDNDPANARALSSAALDPALLGQLLGEREPKWPLVERIARHDPAVAITPLLDALERSMVRSVRRRLLDLLTALGPAIEPVLLLRLPEAPWHLARNIISVLAEFPTLVDAGPVVQMLEHPDLRVRQEALKLLVRVPEARDRAVAAALEDGEPALVRTALAALDGECPPQIVVPLIGLLAEGDEETRLQAIRLLDDANHPLAIGPLLNLVRSRSGLLRRWRLLPATPVMLAALRVLATRWPTHRPVVVTLQLAAHHDDHRVREAIGLFRGGEH
ncbi:MAG: hypothetical protein SFU57_12035 [Gemmatimonadales bacterium]|nr:hypothetical protein [Gemmatimonadales bacterium]